MCAPVATVSVNLKKWLGCLTVDTNFARTVFKVTFSKKWQLVPMLFMPYVLTRIVILWCHLEYFTKY